MTIFYFLKFIYFEWFSEEAFLFANILKLNNASRKNQSSTLNNLIQSSKSRKIIFDGFENYISKMVRN